MSAFARCFLIVCLFLTLGSTAFTTAAAPPEQEGAPHGDARPAESAAPAGVLSAPIKADDAHFIADTGGDLDLYLFRTDRPEGKLKFNIPITRYYFNVEDSNIVFRSDGRLTSDTVTYAIGKKILPATIQLRMRVYDVDEDATGCSEVDLIFINGLPLTKSGSQARLSGANDSWSVVSYDVPVSMLKFPRTKGNNAAPLAAQNEIAIRVDANNCVYQGNPSWAVTVDYGILEIPSPVRPIVFAHGWTGNTSTFTEFETRLKNDGIPSGGQADLGEGLYPISVTALWMSNYIREATLEFGVDKVNLFGHSKGGLVARRAVYDDNVPGKVETILTFDTPHHGTMLADNETAAWAMCHTLKYPFDWTKGDLCYESTKEFSTEGARTGFNYSGCFELGLGIWVNCSAKYVHQPAINYRAFAAVGDPVVMPTVSAQYPWDDDQTPMPWYAPWDILEYAGDVDASYRTSHGDIVKRQDAYQCAIHLLDSTRYSCPGSGASVSAESDGQVAPEDAASVEVARTAAQVIMSQSAALAGSQLYTATAQVDAGVSQLVVEVYSTAALDFTLSDPNGRIVDPAVAAADPAIDYSADQSLDLRRYSYVVSGPVAGVWSAQARSGGAASLTMIALVDSPIELNLLANQAGYKPGDTIVAQAALVQSGVRLPGGVVSGRFELASGSWKVVNFNDNGLDGDATPGDGFFTARFVAPDAKAKLYLSVAADRGATHREKSILITVAAQTGDLGSVTREWTVDDDGDGLIDWLQIQLSFQALQAGHFDLQGELVDANGSLIQAAQFGTRSLNSNPLNPGAYSAVLRFNGRSIWESGKQGRFTLTHLLLADSTGQVFPVDAANTLYTTRSYNRDQFERPALAFESASESASDQNANGRYDVLTFNLRFSVGASGSYNVNGRLVDQNGDEISWRAGSFYAGSAGSYQVALSFPGRDIGNHRVNGPYTLKDVSLYDQAGTASAYFSSVAATRAYSFTDFERDPDKIFLPMLMRGTAPTYEPNDTRGQAYGPLISGQQLQAFIENNSDHDFYYIDISTLGRVSVDLTNINAPTTDIDMNFYDSNGTRVAGSWGVTSSEKTEFLPLNAGRYYLDVYFCCGSNTPTQPYFLTVRYDGAVGAGGIYGTVRSGGGAIGYAPIWLYRWDTQTYLYRRVSTMTDASGMYFFHGMESLSANQYYYLYYPGWLGSGYIGYWYGAPIYNYSSGSWMVGSDIDISPLNLLGPGSTTPVSWPVTFRWTPRPTSPGESYRLHLYDPYDNNVWWNSAALGHTDRYTLTGLPSGFVAGRQYLWYVTAEQGGAEGGSYSANWVVFATSQNPAVESAKPSALHRGRPVDPTLKPQD